MRVDRRGGRPLRGGVRGVSQWKWINNDVEPHVLLTGVWAELGSSAAHRGLGRVRQRSASHRAPPSSICMS